jgi:integrase
MGSVFRKAYTKPLPTGAEIVARQGRRLARWRDSKGKLRTAPVTTGADGSERIRVESGTFFARYRDGNRLVVEVATGCRSEDAARQVLAELERKAERVRSGLISPSEARVADHRSTPIGEHVAAYITSLEASEASPGHVAETRRILKAVLAGCGFATLADLERSAVEHWLNRRRQGGTSARTRNIDLTRLNSLVNWCVANGRLTTNPLRGIPKANEAADPRRRRRSMTEAELVRLLEVARMRPLLDASTVRRGKRKGEVVAKLRPDVRQRLEALGRERALIYKTLVLTGLRRGELASLTVGQLRLDGPLPYVELDAADEKNREGNGVPLRPDLAHDLKQWLDHKLAAYRAEARRRGGPIPARLPAETPLFKVPKKLVPVLNGDLKAAGIPKRDERGRTLDVHALRTTFGTLLSKGGVPLRTAQAAMRHSDPSLTANVYTDPKLLDVAGALDALPTLPPVTAPVERARATGPEAPISGQPSLPLAPPLAQNWSKRRESLTSDDKALKMSTASCVPESSPQVAAVTEENAMVTTVAIASSAVDRRGVEARFPAPEAGKGVSR